MKTKIRLLFVGFTSAVLWSVSALASTSPTLDCYRNAYDQVGAFNAIALCKGTSDAAAPIDCYHKVSTVTGLSATQAIKLCSGTSTATAPLDCFQTETGQKGTLNPFQALSLCAGTSNAQVTENCYQESYLGDNAVFGNNFNYALSLCSR